MSFCAKLVSIPAKVLANRGFDADFVTRFWQKVATNLAESVIVLAEMQRTIAQC